MIKYVIHYSLSHIINYLISSNLLVQIWLEQAEDYLVEKMEISWITMSDKEAKFINKIL